MSTILDGPIEPAKPDHFEDIQAPYRFDEMELAHMNVELRDGLDQIETLEDQKKQASDDFKLRIQGVENRVKQLRNKLKSGEETRPTRAWVEFDSKRSKKRFFYPETGEFIREEDMSPADWQLPMFRKEEVESRKPEQPAPTPEPEPEIVEGLTNEGDLAEHQNDPTAATTSVGDALTAAAAKVQNNKLLIVDFEAKDWEVPGLQKAFRTAAKKAGWSEAEISTMKTALQGCESVSAMRDTLRPHVFTAPELAQQTSSQTTGTGEESLPL